MTGYTTIALTAASTAMTVVGAAKQGQAQQNAANYNAQVASNNATVARQQGEEQARRERRLAKKRMGSMRARNADAMDLIEDSAMEEELSVLSGLYGSRLKEMGHQNTATLDRYSGAAAASAARTKMASSLLMGGAKISKMSATPGTGFDFSSTSGGFGTPHSQDFTPGDGWE